MVFFESDGRAGFRELECVRTDPLLPASREPSRRTILWQNEHFQKSFHDENPLFSYFIHDGKFRIKKAVSLFVLDKEWVVQGKIAE